MLKRQLQQTTELLIAPRAIGALHCRSGQDEPPQRAFRLRIYTEDYEDVGDVFLHGDDAHIISQPAMFHSRSVCPNTIDFDLIAAWIAECHDCHTECGNSLSLQALSIALPVESLLIDVHEECLITARADDQYAALSYVWGDSEQFLLKHADLKSLRAPGSLSGLPIPLTVRDAMALTKAVHLRYLWVDALCIIQNNDTIRTRMVANMHHIYGGAAVTIVAADSAHANSGLPGVQQATRQMQQTVVQVAGLRLVARSCYLDVMLNRSTYNQRGWTYQESCLSSRLLYVTSKGVTFRCSKGFRTEEVMLEEGLCGYEGCLDHTAYMSLSQRNLWAEYVVGIRRAAATKSSSCSCLYKKRARFVNLQLPWYVEPRTIVPIDEFCLDVLSCDDCLGFERANEAEFHTYKQLVRSYTSRQVRYASDRIPAFAGIAALLETQFATSFLYGIPEKHFDFALLWIPRHNHPTPCRKPGLEHIPSWSWASHEIAVDHSGDNWLTSEVNWFLLSRGGDNTNTNLQPVRSLKRFGGSSMPLREDFSKPVTFREMAEHGLLEPEGTLPHPPHLVGWCQTTTSFFTKGTHLYGPAKQLLRGTVLWSDTIGTTTASSTTADDDDDDIHPVELLLLSRTHHQPLIPLVKRMQIRQEDFLLLPHTINALVIQRTENRAKRLAIVDIRDVGLWASVPKSQMLLMLI